MTKQEFITLYGEENVTTAYGPGIEMLRTTSGISAQVFFSGLPNEHVSIIKTSKAFAEKAFAEKTEGTTDWNYCPKCSKPWLSDADECHYCGFKKLKLFVWEKILYGYNGPGIVVVLAENTNEAVRLAVEKMNGISEEYIRESPVRIVDSKEAFVRDSTD